ncbi:hypothetical protein MMC07_002158 [Pseudocyphellaria aurata]|nr:hypothetical protein [Pseudocyphellaria aurata]
MSYASQAAKLPKQSPEEIPPSFEYKLSKKDLYKKGSLCSLNAAPNASRAPAPPSIESTESSSSYNDVSSPHVSSIKSEDLHSEASKTSQSAKEKTSSLSEKASSKTDDFSASASANYDKAKSTASKKASEAKDKAEVARDDLSANRDNPVVMGNAVVIAITAIGLGVGAYQKHKKGELSWGVVGAWAGVVGVFAAGDYYLSQ